MPTFRSAIERRQQRPPSIGHQHAIDHNERAREQDEPPVGNARGVPHGVRIALPEEKGSESDRDQDASALVERNPQNIPRNRLTGGIGAMVC